MKITHYGAVQMPGYQASSMCAPLLHVSKFFYIYSFLPTYSMVQSPSWAANWFAASQEIPHISRNPKDQYRIHKHRPTSLYPGSAQSSPYTHIPPPGDPS